ncbi:MAG: hypothetical protein J0I98_05000 [Mesorhizobium sp.]|nr:hypothetical protein [Mesorhizobium sp.]MBN9242131.1 hypothetical protein [Mesorhizobium sp.]
MSRLVPQSDMTTDEIVQCSYQARAILHLIDMAAWSISNNSGAADVLADSIGAATRLALALLEPVHDALERHEGLKGRAA